MRKTRRAQSQGPHQTASGGARLPKPDFVRTALNAAELHAYYIALISSRSLRVTSDHVLKSS
jgi:hypothetical protein